MSLRFFLLACCAGGVTLRAQPPRDVVIQGVTLVEGEGAPRPGMSVRVSSGRIVEVAPRVHASRGAVVVDGRGKFLIPGLWDLHVHQALSIWKGLPADSSAEYFHALFLAHGVTAVRDMGGDLATLRRWKRAALEGTALVPLQVVTGEKLGQYPVVPGAPNPIRNDADARRAVEMLAAGGADFVKVTDLPPARLDEVSRSARSARLPLAGHVAADITLAGALRAGFISSEHLDDVLLSSTPAERKLRARIGQQGPPPLWERAWRRLTGPLPDAEVVAADGFDLPRFDALAGALKRVGHTLVPTLRMTGVRLRIGLPALRMPSDSFEIRLPTEPRDGYATAPVPAGSANHRVWSRVCEVTGLLHRRGVALLPGTDTPSLYAVPGESLHDELELMVGCGMSPAGVLRAATVGAATLVGAAAESGRIAPGYRGDLVLLDANPLDDIRNTRRIHAVIRGGRLLPRATLDSLVASAAQVVARRRPLFGDR